jgi:hypothetical protein
MRVKNSENLNRHQSSVIPILVVELLNLERLNENLRSNYEY